MAIPSALRLLLAIDRLLPKNLKRLIRMVLPSVGDRVLLRVAGSSPLAPSPSVIQGGPLMGRSLVCSLRTEVSYFLGTHEPAIAAVCEALQPGDCVFDVGGHIGYTALLAAHYVGPSGRVIVFEPHPANRDRIAANLTLNPDLAARITVEPLAVSDEVGFARLGGQESTASLGSAGITVRTTTLDAYESEHRVRPRLIKMDIEGAETRALPAGARLWGEVRPIVAVEVHDLEAWRTLTQLATVHAYEIDQWSAGGWLPAESWNRRDVYRARPSTSS
jgi:FkbM family methyltransferase